MGAPRLALDALQEPYCDACHHTVEVTIENPKAGAFPVSNRLQFPELTVAKTAIEWWLNATHQKNLLIQSSPSSSLSSQKNHLRSDAKAEAGRQVSLPNIFCQILRKAGASTAIISSISSTAAERHKSVIADGLLEMLSRSSCKHFGHSSPVYPHL